MQENKTIRIENPGHSAKLREIGLFSQGQTEIQAIDLAKRAIETGQVEAALEWFSAEIDNLGALVNILFYLKAGTERSVQNAKTLEAVQEAEEKISNNLKPLIEAGALIAGVQVCLDFIKAQQISYIQNLAQREQSTGQGARTENQIQQSLDYIIRKLIASMTTANNLIKGIDLKDLEDTINRLSDDVEKMRQSFQ